MNDPLGDRIKHQYENRTRYYLPRRTYTIVRLDGKSFHTFTRGLPKPYCMEFIRCMDETASNLLKLVDGSIFSYVQSDEISILIQDFKEQDTQAWFDGNIQKICSVSASSATALFNKAVQTYIPAKNQLLAMFDSRVFTIADPSEVANYFLWRTRDCVRNSILCLGQHYLSNSVMHGKKTNQVLDLLIHEKEVNWNNFPERFKKGAVFSRPNKTIFPPHQDLFEFYSKLIKESIGVID